MAGAPAPAALLQAAVMAHAYRDVVTLGFPLPPAPSSGSSSRRSRASTRRGYRAGDFAQL